MAKYSLIPTDAGEKVRKLDMIARTAQAEILTAEQERDDVAKGLIAGAALAQMRELLTDDVMRSLMPLVGTPLGIRTDRDKDSRGYDTSVVRDVVLSGLMKGGRVVGNEMNIIGGNLYLTKEYWERRFRELPGMDSVKPPRLGVPRPLKVGDKEYAAVQCKLEYRYRGKVGRIDCEGDEAILVVWNKGQGIDAIHGKAKKRLFALGFATVTGTHVDLDDEPDAGVVDAAGWKDDDKPTSELELARRSCLSRMRNARDVERLDGIKVRWDAYVAKGATEATEGELADANFDVQAAYETARERLTN